MSPSFCNNINERQNERSSLSQSLSVNRPLHFAHSMTKVIFSVCAAQRVVFFILAELFGQQRILLSSVASCFATLRLFGHVKI